MWEVVEAYEGYALSKGLKKDSKPFTAEEVAELERWEEEEELATQERIRLMDGHP